MRITPAIEAAKRSTEINDRLQIKRLDEAIETGQRCIHIPILSAELRKELLEQGYSLTDPGAPFGVTVSW